MKILNLHHNLLKQENAAETFYGSIHYLAPTQRPTFTKYFCDSLTSTSQKHHKYYKLFNRNNVKISYSCMQNVASIIQNHNANLLKDPIASTAPKGM